MPATKSQLAEYIADRNAKKAGQGNPSAAKKRDPFIATKDKPYFGYDASVGF